MDEELRKAERDATGGDLADRASHVAALVRSGGIRESRVRIFAALGHAASREALGLRAWDSPRHAPRESGRVLAETIVWAEERIADGPALRPDLSFVAAASDARGLQGARPHPVAGFAEALRDEDVRPDFPVDFLDGGSHHGSPMRAFRLSSPLPRVKLMHFREQGRVIAVRSVVERRRAALRAGGWFDDVAADTLLGGRILCYAPSVTLFDGAAAAFGFVDVENQPPWGTWLSYHEGQNPEGGLLLSWVPQRFVMAADSGVEVNPESCIFWLDYPPTHHRCHVDADGGAAAFAAPLSSANACFGGIARGAALP